MSASSTNWTYINPHGSGDEEEGQFFFVSSQNEMTSYQPISTPGNFEVPFAVYSIASGPPVLPVMQNNEIKQGEFAVSSITPDSALFGLTVPVVKKETDTNAAAPQKTTKQPKAERVIFRAARGKRRSRRDSDEIVSDSSVASSSSSPSALDMSPEGDDDEPPVLAPVKKELKETKSGRKKITVAATSTSPTTSTPTDNQHGTRSRSASLSSLTSSEVEKNIEALRIGAQNHCAGQRRRQNHPKCAPMPGNKRERNAVSALNYRKRRKMYVVELESKNEELAGIAENQVGKINSLETENKMLKEQLEFYQKYIAMTSAATSTSPSPSFLPAVSSIPAAPVATTIKKTSPTPSLHVALPPKQATTASSRKPKRGLDASLPLSPTAPTASSAPAVSTSSVEEMYDIPTLPSASNNTMSASALADSELMMMLPLPLSDNDACISSIVDSETTLGGLPLNHSVGVDVDDLTSLLTSASSSSTTEGTQCGTWEMIDIHEPLESLPFSPVAAASSNRTKTSASQKVFSDFPSSPISSTPFRQTSGVFMFTLFSLFLLFVPTLFNMGSVPSAPPSLTYSSPSSSYAVSAPPSSLFASLTGVYTALFTQPETLASPTGRKILNATELEVNVGACGDDVEIDSDDLHDLPSSSVTSVPSSDPTAVLRTRHRTDTGAETEALPRHQQWHPIAA